MSETQTTAGPVRKPGWLPPEQIEAAVRAAVPEGLGAFEARGDDSTLWVEPRRLVEVARFLKADPRLRFDFLMNLCGIDWKDKLGVVYHFFSYPFRHRFGIKVPAPYEDPHVPSLGGVYKTALWQEREAYDLYGVVFDGHPDLRRVLMPEDWVGHPMRKDYQEPPDYRGIPTTRPNPLVILEEFNKREQDELNKRRAADAAATGGGPAGGAGAGAGHGAGPAGAAGAGPAGAAGAAAAGAAAAGAAASAAAPAPASAAAPAPAPADDEAGAVDAEE
ncbi:MAG TPA: NADH-quinone oxidoreductase subunit C [Myxococcota bacterium]|nr:NADH-quinone oxidoreductase subunit C [Myxococcota bacterium]